MALKSCCFHSSSLVVALAENLSTCYHECSQHLSTLSTDWKHCPDLQADIPDTNHFAPLVIQALNCLTHCQISTHSTSFSLAQEDCGIMSLILGGISIIFCFGKGATIFWLPFIWLLKFEFCDYLKAVSNGFATVWLLMIVSSSVAPLKSFFGVADSSFCSVVIWFTSFEFFYSVLL